MEQIVKTEQGMSIEQMKSQSDFTIKKTDT